MTNQDQWYFTDKTILSLKNKKIISDALEKGLIIMQHWFYRGSKSPERYFFEDMIDFEKYINKNATPGDAFDIWAFNDVCKKDNLLVEGKFPDSEGKIPLKGAY